MRTLTSSVISVCRLAAIPALALVATCFLTPAQPVRAAGTEALKGSDPCTLGETLGKAGETEEARKAFVKALEQDPSQPCASEGLKALTVVLAQDKSAENCAIGRAFLDVNHNEDATAAYKKALEDNPGSKCAAEGLEDAGPSPLTDIADDITGSIPTVLVFAGLIVLAGYLVLLLCRWDRLKQGLVSIWGIGKHLKHALRPRLAFNNFSDDAVEGKPGQALTARVKERLNRMREEALSMSSAAEYDLDFGNPREEFADQVSESKSLQTALDSASEVNEQAKLVAALIKIATIWLPISRFGVGGSLEPPSTSGAALTLSVEEEGRSETSVHLVGSATSKPSKASDYMTLADPAAVWIQYEIACALSGEEWDATKAESQAVLREGLDRYHLGDDAGAKKAFEQAISLDHTNWGAYVSLAVAEARIGGNYEESIARILEGIEKMRGVDA